MLERIARFAVTRKRIMVFAIWLPAMIAIGAASGALGAGYRTEFRFPDSESNEVFEILEANNPNKAGFTSQVVVKAASVADPTLTAAFSGVLAQIDTLEGIDVASPYDNPQQINGDGTIAFAQLDVSERNTADLIALADEIKALGAPLIAVPNTQVAWGGDVFAEFEFPPAEAFGLIAAVIILIIAFGSVLAMGLPIGTAILGLATGMALTGIVSHTMSMPEFTPQMAAMVGLGVGIDYALFIVTRHREGLRNGLSNTESIVASVDTAGRAVMFAGLTVVISLLGLFIIGIPFVSGLATGMIIGVLVMMIASITLLPALLAMADRRINDTSRAAMIAIVVAIVGAIAAIITTNPIFLFAFVLAILFFVVSFAIPPLRKLLPHRHEPPVERSFWYRWSRLIQRRPWPAALLGAAILIVFSLPMFSIRLGFGDYGNAHDGSSARVAYDLIAEGFGPGANGPIIIPIEGATPEQAQTFAATVGSADGVAFVVPSQMPPGAPIQLVIAYPTTSPQDEATTELVRRLRDEVVPSTGLDAKVGGFTAASVDFADYLGKRLPILIAAVLVLSFLLLMAVFRSLLVPLKAVIMNLLSIGASYGVVTAIFQWGWGRELIGVGKEGPIEAWVPMMLFAIVFGLSMDYEVFLLSRMKEDYDRSRDNATAVANGLAATARVITAAALIMVCVFAAFVLGHDRQLKLFGLGLAFAVFVDATIVRMLLVPATMELLGDRNWWLPKWLDRLLPRINVEGGHHATSVAEVGRNASDHHSL